jgi:hypothetical protein
MIDRARTETTSPVSASGKIRARLTARDSAILIALYLGALGLFLPFSLFGITIFDEGFIVTGAMQVLHGRLPYRDFSSLYGPGQFYLVAGLFAVFGERLIVAHVAHAALLAGLAVTVFELSQVATANRRAISFVTVLAYAGIVLYAQPNVLYPAISATLALLLAVLALGRYVLKQRQWMLGVTSLAVGAAGTLRWDFGVFGLIGLVVTVAGFVLHHQARPKHRLSTLLWATGPALAVMAVVYVPLLVILTDPIRWYQEVLQYSLAEFPRWRNRDFARPAFWTLVTSWRHGDANQFSQAVLQLAYVALPLTLALATLGIVGVKLARGKTYPTDRASVQSFLVGFLTFCLLNQMRVRAGLWQGFPAAVACLPLLCYVRGLLPAGGPLGAATRIAMSSAAFVLGAFLFHPALQGWMRTIDSRAIELDTPRGAGVRVERNDGYYAELVNHVRAQTRDGEFIYSGASDHSRLFVNDPMLYFLSNRSPADRFVELEPGIANTKSAQQEIVNALQEKSVRIVVLVEFESAEPNLTSRSNGIHDLDHFLIEHYRPVRKFGPYTVLEAK